MAVVVTGLCWTPLRTPGDRLRVRLLLGALVALTPVVVGSALYRLWLYQQAYGLTVLRLVVAAPEVWLATGFVIMLVSVLRLRPGRPTRGVVAAGMLTLFVLAALNPKRPVAEQNVQRSAATGTVDVSYLAGLSADAAPVLATLPEPVRSCALTGLPAALTARDRTAGRPRTSPGRRRPTCWTAPARRARHLRYVTLLERHPRSVGAASGLGPDQMFVSSGGVPSGGAGAGAPPDGTGQDRPSV